MRFVDFKAAPEPLLVMEYLPRGDLQAQHKLSSITDDEMMVVFYQCLEGLAYLHDRNITHRDLKLENILFFSRTLIHIKLADFGFAQDKPDLKTFCGSPMYAAPEIFLGEHYTAAVDVWSLAVIVMKFVYGLPQCRKPNSSREYRSWGEAWCRHLITTADDWDSDLLINFLTKCMLRWIPEERLPAVECVKRGHEIGLFKNEFWQTGSANPRLRPESAPGDIDTEEASTIKEPLWQRLSPFLLSVVNDRDIHRSQGAPSPLRCELERLSHGRSPGQAAQTENPSQSYPYNFDYGLGVSEIDRLDMSRPSLRFMRPSQPSQPSRSKDAKTSQSQLSSLIIPSGLSCFKPEAGRPSTLIQQSAAAEPPYIRLGSRDEQTTSPISQEKPCDNRPAKRRHADDPLGHTHSSQVQPAERPCKKLPKNIDLYYQVGTRSNMVTMRKADF